MKRRSCDVCGVDCTSVGFVVTIVRLQDGEEMQHMTAWENPSEGRDVCPDHIGAVHTAVGMRRVR